MEGIAMFIKACEENESRRGKYELAAGNLTLVLIDTADISPHRLT